jgi:hypothetical protein
VVEAFDELEDEGKIIIAARQSAEREKKSQDSGDAEQEKKDKRSNRYSSPGPPVLVEELIMYVLEDEVHQGIEKLTQLLELTPGKNLYRLKIGLIGGGGEEIMIETRSLMSAMFYLGQSIEIPQSLRDAGVVNYIVDDTGQVFNWNEMFKGLFAVHASSKPPGVVDGVNPGLFAAVGK